MNAIENPQKEIAQRDGRFPKNTKQLSENVTEFRGVGQAKKPTIKYNSLIVVTGDKDKTRKSLLVCSSAIDILQDALKGFYSYDPASGLWYEFTGAHWQALGDHSQVDDALFELLRIGAGDLGFWPTYEAGVKRFLVRGDKLRLPKVNNSKLPFKNGLLDLNTKRLEPVTAANAQTWSLPYEYSPGADCPRTKAWLLQRVDGDEGTVRLLFAFIAAVLLGRYDLQSYLHLKGSGGTGKSTLISLIMALIGEINAAGTTLKHLEENRFETAKIYNKRLVVISDSDKYGGSINVLKNITGGDPIRLERKGVQQKEDFVFKGMVVIASNESLQTTDYTSGGERRPITVIFDRRITAEEKLEWDRQGGIEGVLLSELPGIVNVALKFSHDEITEIIKNPPERVLAANLEASIANNHAKEWLLERTEPESGSWTQIGDKREFKGPDYQIKYEHDDKWLYPNYLQWCSRNNKSPMSLRRFKDIVLDTCQTMKWDVAHSKKDNARGISGLRLKPVIQDNGHQRHQDERQPF